MEKNEKKLVTTIAVSFVAGVVVTLGILTFGCCPKHHGPRGQFMAPPAQVEMGAPMAKHHHGFHHGFKGKHFEPTPEMKERFAQRLGLTDEQKQKLEEMRQADMAKMEPLFKQADELHQKIKELRKVNREHFESVLTDGQKEILKEMKKEHHHQRENI